MSFKVFIETIGKSFNYSFPDDKSHQLYDFYMLAYLTNRSSFDSSVKQAYQQGISITPPKSDFLSMNFEDKLDYALKEVANELLPKLKKELLEATFWSIACEARHIISFINNNKNNYNEVAKELNSYEKSLFKKYLKSLIISDYNSFLLRNKTDRVYEKNIEASAARKAAYQTAISVTEHPIEFVKLFRKIFALDFAWSPSYGGKAWKNICEGWLSLYNAKTTSELFINIDHIYDLQHNTDTVFNKLQSYLKDNSYKWLKRALNFKANIKDPHQIIDKISPSFKKLAIKVIFKKFGKSYEEFTGKSNNIDDSSNNNISIDENVLLYIDAGGNSEGFENRMAFIIARYAQRMNIDNINLNLVNNLLQKYSSTKQTPQEILLSAKKIFETEKEYMLSFSENNYNDFYNILQYIYLNVSASLLHLIITSDRLTAIKAFRNGLGWSLLASKLFIDYLRNHNITSSEMKDSKDEIIIKVLHDVQSPNIAIKVARYFLRTKQPININNLNSISKILNVNIKNIDIKSVETYYGIELNNIKNLKNNSKKIIEYTLQTLYPETVKDMKSSKKIDAVRYFYKASGWPLLDSKNFIELWLPF